MKEEKILILKELKKIANKYELSLPDVITEAELKYKDNKDFKRVLELVDLLAILIIKEN